MILLEGCPRGRRWQPRKLLRGRLRQGFKSLSLRHCILLIWLNIDLSATVISLRYKHFAVPDEVYTVMYKYNEVVPREIKAHVLCIKQS